MKWEAIGIGAAIGVAIALAWHVVMLVFMGPDPAANLSWLAWVGAAVGLVADIACGAAAGWFARTRGAVHGLLANVLAIVGGAATGAVINKMRGMELAYFADGGYWSSFVVWAVPGLGIAALAGWVGGSLRRVREQRGEVSGSAP